MWCRFNIGRAIERRGRRTWLWFETWDLLHITLTNKSYQRKNMYNSKYIYKIYVSIIFFSHFLSYTESHMSVFYNFQHGTTLFDFKAADCILGASKSIEFLHRRIRFTKNKRLQDGNHDIPNIWLLYKQ